MSGILREYNSSEIAMSFAGIPISGLADGEFVTIEMVSDDFGNAIGTDGEVTSFRTNDRRANVTFKLMQSSQSIPALMAVSNADLAALNGGGVGALQIANLTTGERWECPTARLSKQPNASLGREPTAREFAYFCSSLFYTPGNP